VDIDIVYLNGYGLPAWRGGPFPTANVASRTSRENRRVREKHGDGGLPAPLLKKLVAEGEDLSVSSISSKTLLDLASLRLGVGSSSFFSRSSLFSSSADGSNNKRSGQFSALGVILFRMLACLVVQPAPLLERIIS